MDERAAITPELMDIRTDERFDEACLADYLRGRLPPQRSTLDGAAVCERQSQSDLSPVFR